MNDLLNFDFINSLPQQLFAVEWSGDYKWPIIDIDVQTGLLRIDVCGLLQVMHISDYGSIIDGSGTVHRTEVFYNEN